MRLLVSKMLHSILPKQRAYLIPTILLLFFGNNLFAQRTITGKVTGTDNTPIVNASIIVRGTAVGTHSDENGNFTISAPANKSVLVISSVGYQQQEITVTGNTVPQIKLALENTTLSEVVVTGYSRQSKRDVTGAASTVSA
ncbi:MAG: carboxypeptidase-like regulatory domain-containing protein, partial [Ginsengibacter sp.]